MPENQRKNNNNHNRPPEDKKPRLTHFLCLPLVNPVSLPQLESSLATFKAAIPSLPPAIARGRDPNDAQGETPVEQVQNPLIPDGALRPLGTLHLTLGVMSLPTKERLEEALEFFQSLDLAAMMHEAENRAQRYRLGRKERSEQSLSCNMSDNGIDSVSVNRQPPQPLNISLESLHALPRARSATVLHAVPVDPTSRLYPFCEMLRDKFLEAGFMLGENKGSQKPQSQAEGTFQEDEKSKNEKQQEVSNSTGVAAVAASDTRDVPMKAFEELPVNVAEEQPTKSIAKSVRTPKPKPRPLLLHATVVNTIYIKGRWQGGGPSKKNNKKKSNDRYTFDARDVLDHYRDYYLDSTRTTPRSAMAIMPGATRENPNPPEDAIDAVTEPEGNAEQGPNDNIDDSAQKKRKKSIDNVDTTVKIPFVWAKDFPLDSVCICEMGAKRLDPNEDGYGLNARLGEKYRVIAERSLAWDDLASLRPVTQTFTPGAPVRKQTLTHASDINLEGDVRGSESSVK